MCVHPCTDSLRCTVLCEPRSIVRCSLSQPHGVYWYTLSPPSAVGRTGICPHPFLCSLYSKPNVDGVDSSSPGPGSLK